MLFDSISNIGKGIGKAIFPYLLGDKGNAEKSQLGNKAVSQMAKFAGLSYKKDSPDHLEGYGEFLSKYSNDDVRVYKDDGNKTISVSIRGTDPSKVTRALKDFKSDILGVVFGLKDDDPRFWEANRIIETLKHTFKDYKINTFGHSLGGSISKYISQKNPEVQSVVFNAGSSPLVKEEKQSNVIQFGKSGDLISAFNNPNNTGGTSYSSTLAGHGLSNFY